MESDRDFDGPYHGADGPIGVRRLFPDIWPGYTAAMMEAAQNSRCIVAIVTGST